MKVVKGNLLYRTLLNRRRLTDKMYTADDIFYNGGEWYGDFQGRAILSLSSLYHALEGYPEQQESILKQLNDIFSRIDHFLNSEKYFGAPFNKECVDEQQLAGHSWFVRGLIEYYLIVKEPRILNYLKSIVDHYLIPLSPLFESYPIGKRKEGGVSGHIDDKVESKWKVSSDAGCAFIALDGYTAAYELLKDPRLKPIIENLIEKFSNIDYVNLQYQTHAVLSCTRGILRYYKLSNDAKYLNLAAKIFDLYLRRGLTYDYSNINWFNRPDTWTEPCCIIDSMIICKKLYLATENTDYLDLFNRIYVNSIRTFQRNNGGAGCSTCATEDRYELKVHLYEAFFCCTMRLGEGLKEIIDFSILPHKDGYLIPYLGDFCYDDDNLELEVHADIYQEEQLTIEIKNIRHPADLIIRIPPHTSVEDYNVTDRFIRVSLTEAETKTIRFNSRIENENGFMFKGDKLLTKKNHSEEQFFIVDTQKYSYLYDSSTFSESELSERIQYVR